MTIINPNSISGITSFTAEADVMNFYKSNGALGSLQLNGCNFYTPSGISTFNNLVVGGTLTYEDVKNVDSVGIITARGGLNVTANTDTDTLNVSGISTFVGNAQFSTLSGSGALVYSTGSGVLDDSVNHTISGNTLQTVDIEAQGNITVADKIIHRSDTNTSIRFPANDTVSVETNGSEKLRIDSSGRVLIGTTSADDTSQKLKLHQAGNDHCLLNLNVSSSSYSSLINFGDSGSWSIGQIAYAHSDDSLRFKVNGGERVRIDSSGNVNIGVNVSSNPFTYLRFGASQYGAADIRPTDEASHKVGLAFYTDGTQDTTINPTERLRIDSSGVVHLKSNTSAQNTTKELRFSPTTSTTRYASIQAVNNSGNNHIDLRFFTANADTPAERLRIKNDGEVLIGTTTDRPIAGQRYSSGSGWGGSLQLEKANPTSGNNAVPFFAITAWNGANEQYTGGISFNRSNNNTQGTHGAVNTNQQLGNIAFNGSDGTNFIQGAEIFAIPEQTFATNDGPTALCFGTVPDGTGETRPQERLRIHSDGKISTGAITNPQGAFCIDTGSGGSQANTLELRRDSTSDYHAVSFFTGTTCDWSIGQNSAGDFEIFEDGADSYTRLSVHTGGTVQVQNHLTSRNGIVQINQVTSTTRYSGSIASVDLITGSTFTPKTSAPRFLIMIFCPMNTSDDSDAHGGNTNPYHYGRIEYRKNGGSWTECDNQGVTTQQGGNAAHIELSPNRTGDGTTDYWSQYRYRLEHKSATILATNVGDCGATGNVQFKLRGYTSNQGNFVQIGQPHGYGTDDNYPVQPWGFTVFELAPDSNSYTAY